MATDAILRNKNSVFQYFMNEMGRRAWANEVYFPPNSEVSNLIEWYLLYFRTVLTIKFKMITQDGIFLTFKIQDGNQRHIENQEKVLSLEPNVPKKQMKQLFLLSLQPISNGMIFTVFWNHLTFKSEMATQFVCLFVYFSFNLGHSIRVNTREPLFFLEAQ